MQGAPYRQMRSEAGNWVKRGRMRLLEHLVTTHSQHPRHILEVGAGFGGNLALLASLGRVDAAESNPEGIDALKDLAAIDRLFATPFPFETDEHWDVICAIEVLEHLLDDQGAVHWVFDHLRPGGLFVATVPAHPLLFTDHDRVVGHHRRYRRRTLAALVPDDAEILAMGWFNATTLPAAATVQGLWHLSRRVRGDQRHVKPPTPSSGLLDRVLGGVLRAEIGLLKRGVPLPPGNSLYLAARRR